MNFSEALGEVKKGYPIARNGWNGKGMFVLLQTPDENSKMTRPYLYMVLPYGSTTQFGMNDKAEKVPWLVSQTDLLSDDWFVVPTGKAE